MNNNTQENIPENLKDQVQIDPQVESVINAEDGVDPDWRKVREQRKADRRAREEAEKRASDKAAEAEALKAAMEALMNKPTQQQQNFFNEEHEISDDEKIKRRVDEIIREREVQYLKDKEEKEKIEYPKKLREDMKDFDKVCDPENLDYLEYHYPELTEPLKYMPEGYKKWAAIYKLTKKFVPNLDHKQDQKRAEKNLAKPGSISSIGTTQGSGSITPTRLTEEMKAANWLRMERDRKGLK